MSTVYIMRGVQGSGKSFKASLLQEVAMAGDALGLYHPVARIVSADHYWITETGEYVFDPEKIGLAHAECFKTFMQSCSNSQVDGGMCEHTIIVDNTNIELHEMAPISP